MQQGGVAGSRPGRRIAQRASQGGAHEEGRRPHHDKLRLWMDQPSIAPQPLLAMAENPPPAAPA